MEFVTVQTIKDLKELIKDLKDDAPVGTYYRGHWTPTFEHEGVTMKIIDGGLAANIDHHTNY